jgi:hypothetical protein
MLEPRRKAIPANSVELIELDVGDFAHTHPRASLYAAIKSIWKRIAFHR